MNTAIIESIVENNTFELHYGLVNEELKHISDVNSGLECHCTCPHCGNKLIAKKGNIRTHHFAHYESMDCNHGAETAIHLLAKEIIAEHKVIQLPAIYCCETLNDDNQHPHFAAEFIPSKLVQLFNVQVETKMVGYQPDLTAQKENNEWLDIEIKVTHEVDEDKSASQIERQREMLEIDLSKLPRTANRAEIAEAVLYHAPRHFIYSFQADESKFQAESTLNSTIEYVNELIETARNNVFNNDNETSSVILLGYKFGNGYSAKNNSNFSISKLFYAVPTQSHSTRNFSITDSGGFEVKEVMGSGLIIPTLKKLTFPIKVDLRFEAECGVGRQNKLVVSDIIL
jgi:hypothetical protein